MKITILQSDLVWENKYRNLEKFGELISSLNGNTDIVVLPEMFSTGFSMNPEELCRAPFSETYNWMMDLSAKGNFSFRGVRICPNICYDLRFPVLKDVDSVTINF